MRGTSEGLFLDDKTRMISVLSSRSETDITAVFGTAIPGSNPGGSTNRVSADLCWPERVGARRGRVRFQQETTRDHTR